MKSTTNKFMQAKRIENPGIELVFDADGNPTADRLWIYEWDEENRLIKMTSQLADPAMPVNRIEFQYDWQGRRIAKRCCSTQIGTATTNNQLFIYDGRKLIASTDGNKAVQAACIWGTRSERPSAGRGRRRWLAFCPGLAGEPNYQLLSQL